MKQMWARVGSLWSALWRAEQLDRAMHDEMRFHIEMETERLMREERLDEHEARRQAYVAFGGVEKYKEEGRDTRRLRWMDAVALDGRLALRMLVKHRGLTLIGGFAIAVAIAIGATFFEVLSELLDPTLPVDQGDRVVSLQYVTANSAAVERRVLHDFVAWREGLRSVERLGAFRNARLNLVPVNGPPEPIRAAEITASGFDLAGTAPFLGRYLLAADERASASPVVVIGHEAWQSRFGGDLDIVGRTLNLSGVPHSVVGVMPEGFRFPVDHHYWIPLRANPLRYERLQGPELFVFGRLAPGVTMPQAQAELTAIGQRVAAAHPATHERLQPILLPYTREHLDLTDPGVVWLLRIAQLLIGALAFVVSVNLAILVYARTVTRLGEIAVRTALGASRCRILAQLFIEAFALSVAGAVTGLALAHVALGGMQDLASLNGSVPFWIDFKLSVGTAIYALALAILAAAIIGVLPGLKATGSSFTANLHDLNSRTGTRLGSTWTALVVAQVAVAVTVLPAAAYLGWGVVQLELAGPGIAVERFVVASVAVGDDSFAVDSSHTRRRQLELTARLEAEPGVSAVTFSSFVPGLAGGRQIRFDPAPEAGTAAQATMDDSVHDVSTVDVALDIFDVYGVELLAGRAFTADDVGAANAVIVNHSFAHRFLPARSALGVRFGYVRPLGQHTHGDVRPEWYQIVGIVRDFPSFPPGLTMDNEAVVYHPAAPGDIHPMVFSVRFGGAVPVGFPDRVRAIGAQVDPALQFRRVVPLSQFYGDLRSFWRYMAWGVALLTTSVLLLSAAGIYALMSFTIAKRTREIGVRIALGAHPRHILLGIFRRAIAQLALGVLVGSVLSGAVFLNVNLSISRAALLLLSVAGVMMVVGILAAFGPARRGLSIQPSDALRTET